MPELPPVSELPPVHELAPASSAAGGDSGSGPHATARAAAPIAEMSEVRLVLILRVIVSVLSIEQIQN